VYQREYRAKRLYVVRACHSPGGGIPTRTKAMQFGSRLIPLLGFPWDGIVLADHGPPEWCCKSLLHRLHIYHRPPALPGALVELLSSGGAEGR
jgi:hypothetical protein